MRRLLNWCFLKVTHRAPGRVLLIGLILSAISIWVAKDLRYDSRMDNLLPQELELVQEFHQVVDKTGGSGPLVVVLEGLEQAKAPPVLKVLAERLSNVEGTRFVDWKLPKEFLDNRQLLLASVSDLKKLENLMIGAVEFARTSFSNFFGSRELYNPGELQSLSDDYQIFDEINPFYKGKSQKRYYMFVQPKGAVTNTDFTQRFVDNIRTSIAESKLEEQHPGLAIRLTGSMIPRLEESKIIIQDLTRAAILAAILATALIFIYTRSWFSIPFTIFPLFISLTYTFALTRLIIGHVNIISGFLVAILMGLGIDYGIHLYIRFKQELLKGLSVEKAVELVVTQVGRSGTVAMCTTIGVFSLLIVSDFKGFSEFGVIASIGIVCAFFSYYFLFPAQVLFYDKIHWLQKPQPRLFSLRISNLYSNTPYFLSALFVLLMTASIFLIPKVEFEYDFEKLKGESPAAEYETETTDDFGFAFSPTVVVTHNKEDLFEIHRALEEIKRKFGDQTTIGIHSSLNLFSQREYDSKQEILKRIQKLFKKENDIIEISLGTTRFEKLKQLVNADPFDESAIPEVLKQRFAAGGEYVLLIFSPADKNFFDVRNIYQLDDEITELKSKLKEKGIQVQVLNENLIAAAIMDWVIEKGPMAMGVALTLVFIILLIDLRNPILALKTFLPLFTGLALTGALMALFNIKLNFINIVMLPSIVGIMIDHCIYLGHHILDDPSSDPINSVKETGSSILLSALTSLAGYMSLNVAHHAGIRSIAEVVEVGIITCTICALIMLPALFAWKNHRLKFVMSKKDLEKNID
ncbi:MAG: MMPL family transporter [Candidatus Nitronauta litoralis]|uniref:MMPL family transporter n=1 Tax=Candidatus Nitronauta litoralis TaxID=2705533 RepID=A0A7T0BXB4_9BACT|nr:MAG: MMPL family transporter [Candidatus Nitronauta litoralis]